MTTQSPPRPSPYVNGYTADTPMVRATIDAVAGYYSIHPEALTGRSRFRTACRVRMVLMYVLRKRGLTFDEIGVCLGRDHTTIMYGVCNVEERMAADDSFRREVAYLLERIGGKDVQR